MNWLELLQMLGPYLFTGGIGAYLMYFKYKPKHPVEVRAAEVKIESDEIRNDNQIIEQYREEHKRLKDRLDQAEMQIDTISEDLAEERRSRSKQEGECDRKIAQLRKDLYEAQLREKEVREQLNDVLGQIAVIKTRCKNNCFEDAA